MPTGLSSAEERVPPLWRDRLQRGADDSQLVADLGSHEEKSSDCDDCDKCKDQGVLGETLTVILRKESIKMGAEST
jgi:hypothetical protein